MNKVNFKKIGIVLIQILCVILAFTMLNRIFMPKYTGEYADGRTTAEFYREETPLDVIFVGTSVVFSATSPVKLWEDYGYTSYVRANSSQTPWISYYMVEDAIAVNKPKLVVMDAGFLSINDDYYEDASNRKDFDYMPNSKRKYRAIKDSSPSDYVMWDYVFPILRYHDRWDDLSLEDIKYSLYIPNQTHNGHIISTKESIELDDYVDYDSAAAMEISPRAISYLYQIITLCRDNDVDFLLIKTPSYKPRWNTQYDQLLTNIAIESGISYINYDFRQGEMQLDYYHDSNDGGGHLNTYGAEKFTHVLGSDIENIFGYESHFDDPAYKAVWDKKVRDYESEKANK